MVIEQVGKATGNVIQSTGQGFSEATQGLPWWAKAGIIAGGIGVAGYLAYYAIGQLTGPTGGSCTTPGTPCYEALQPYQQQFNTCSQQYATYLNQYLKEDSANGTGFTSAQLSQLNYLENCMNTAAGNIANTAKQYEPANVLDIVATFVGAGIFAALSLYGAGKFFSALKNNKPVTGSGAGNAMKQAMIRNSVENGEVSTDEAAGLESQLSDLTQQDVQGNDTMLNNYVTDEVITQSDAQIIAQEDETNMDDDTVETDDYLAGAGGE